MGDLPLTDLAALNASSRDFAATLFQRWPEWRDLAVYDPEEGTLLVEIAPEAPQRPKVRLYTDDDEVTVEFDLWHAHYDWAGESREDEWQGALDLVADLLAERLAVQVWMAGDRWSGSALAQAGDGWLAFPEGWDASDLTRSYRRSFRGTFDDEQPLFTVTPGPL